MSTIDPKTLAERLPADDLVVVDIRHQSEFDEWHIPGSRNVDVYDDVRENPEGTREAFGVLPEDEDIVTVCGFGVVSSEAADMLRDLGFDARNLEDGMVGWSQVHVDAAVDAAIPGTLLQIARPGTGCLSYLLLSDGDAAVFDPSQYVDQYVTRLAERDATLRGVFETHAQGDHLSGGPSLAERYDVPYYLHPGDDEGIDATSLADGESVVVGDAEIDVIHTPGHSPGSVTYAIEDEILLTGDTLFHDSVGRVELGATADLEDARAEHNAATLYESLQRLLDRPGDPLVLPAHDPGSPRPPVVARLSTVRRQNQDLGTDRSAFIDRIAATVREPPPNARQIKRANVGLEEVDPTERTTLELGPNRCAAE